VCAPEAGAIADAIEQLLDSASAGSGVDEGWLADYEWDAVARRVAGALS
jgi:hypothetical protein